MTGNIAFAAPHAGWDCCCTFVDQISSCKSSSGIEAGYIFKNWMEGDKILICWQFRSRRNYAGFFTSSALLFFLINVS